MDVLHSCVAMAGIIGLIIGFRVNAIIALLLGCIYLGLTAGLGMGQTISTVTGGFGEIMMEVGLLIGFGVLLGTILSSLGAVQRLTVLLLRVVGPKRFPYALTAASSAIFPAIYPEAQLVLAAPIVRTAAPALGRNGLGFLAGAQAVGMAVGFAFVVPGLIVVTVAGLVGASLGTVLLFGIVIGPAAALITLAIWALLLRMGIWNPAKDEAPTDDETESGVAAESGGSVVVHGGASGGVATAVGLGVRRRTPNLSVMLVPVIVPLLLIATSSIASTNGIEQGPLVWIGNPTLALFVGMLLAYGMARKTLGRRETEKTISQALNTTGQVLLVTGVGGSLGAVLKETELNNTLGSWFSDQSGASVIGVVLLAFGVAALLHLIIGSASVAAITAAGMLAPLMTNLDISAVAVVMAICSGCLFAVQVNSNVFWMFQTVMKVTTSGALKTLTLLTSVSSIVSLPMVMIVALLT